MLVCKEIAQICLQNVLIPKFNVFFYIKPYTDQYFTYYYMMSANWVSVKIMVPSECRPTGFLPTARPPLQSIKKRRYYHRKFTETRVQNFKTLYNKQTNIIRKQFKELYNNKWQRVVNDINNGNRNKETFWKSVKTILGTQKERIKINKIIENDIIYESDSEIASCLGKHFSKVFKDSNNENFDDLWKEKVDKLIQNTDLKSDPDENNEITQKDILNSIRELKVNKACGPDKIHNQLLKQLPISIINKIQILFQKSINTGIIPQIWKSSTISVIAKPGKDVTKTGSYRPISLTSCLCKLMERIINRKFTEHLETNNILLPEQSGFRKNKSLVDNLTRLCTDINNTNMKTRHKNILLACFLDIEKCFDKIWLNGLKYKILSLDYSKNIRIWLCNFLTNRKFQVKINNRLSKFYDISAGVPQGAILSPTLYGLYSSDIPRNQILSHGTKISAYADDLAFWNVSKITHHYYARTNLQKSIDLVTNWANRWRLNLNPTKCNTVLFNKLKVDHDETYYMPIYINEEPIPKVDEIKFLGLTLTSNFKFDNHIDTIISKSYGVIRGIKLAKYHRVDTAILLQLYSTLIRSIITFANPAWVPFLFKYQMKKLETLQNKIIKLCLGLPPWTKTKYILEMSNFSKLSEYLEKQTRNYILKNKQNELLNEHIHSLEIQLNTFKDKMNITGVT